MAPWAAQGAGRCLEIIEMGLCQVAGRALGAALPSPAALPRHGRGIPAHEPLCHCTASPAAAITINTRLLGLYGPRRAAQGSMDSSQTLPQGAEPSSWPQRGTQLCGERYRLMWRTGRPAGPGNLLRFPHLAIKSFPKADISLLSQWHVHVLSCLQEG